METIRKAFIQYRQQLVGYVYKRLGDFDQAEDIVQDAFVRLLEMQVGVRPESVKNLLFTTCLHLLFDHLRRQRIVQDANIYMYMEESRVVADADQRVRVHEVEQQERRVVNAMPDKRQKVYRLSRYEGQTIDDIASRLQISPRTVEAHLFASRKEIREKLRAFAS